MGFPEDGGDEDRIASDGDQGDGNDYGQQGNSHLGKETIAMGKMRVSRATVT